MYKYPFIAKDALDRIYKRGIVKRPHVIEVDAGKEFATDFLTHFNAGNTSVRVKKAGRHRAQSVVEAKNAIISKVIQARQLNQELTTKEKSVEWVQDLPEIIKLINKHYSHAVVAIDPLDPKVQPIKVKANTLASVVLDVGTPVRIQLDNPINAVDDKKLIGKFRVGDIRWSKELHHITWIFLKPNQPPSYKVDNIDVAYTRNQLQVVQKDEVQPIDKSNKKFIVERILNK